MRTHARAWAQAEGEKQAATPAQRARNGSITRSEEKRNPLSCTRTVCAGASRNAAAEAEAYNAFAGHARTATSAVYHPKSYIESLRDRRATQLQNHLYAGRGFEPVSSVGAIKDAERDARQGSGGKQSAAARAPRSCQIEWSLVFGLCLCIDSV